MGDGTCDAIGIAKATGEGRPPSEGAASAGFPEERRAPQWGEGVAQRSLGGVDLTWGLACRCRP